MGQHYGSKISRNGLVAYLDAANPRSYPGSGTTWNDLSGNSKNFSNTAMNYSAANGGVFTLTNSSNSILTESITTSTSATVVIWMKTTDDYALFVHGNDNGYYLGAYRSANKEYYGNGGSAAQFLLDTVDRPNIYDYFPDGNWHMVEFKNIDFSAWNSFKFNTYSGFTFGTGSIASIMVYDRSITQEESNQNFEAFRGRFGI